MNEAAGFSTKDVTNIAAVAGDCLRSRKIDVRTARRNHQDGRSSPQGLHRQIADRTSGSRRSRKITTARFRLPSHSCAKLKRCSPALPPRRRSTPKIPVNTSEVVSPPRAHCTWLTDECGRGEVILVQPFTSTLTNGSGAQRPD